MTAFRTLDDMELKGKRVLTRVDLNLPMKDGVVGDRTRIARVLPTIEELSDKGARVVVVSHFGRPKGKPVAEMSLAPIAKVMAEMRGKPVAFASDCVGEKARSAIDALGEGDVILLENTRFHAGEEENEAGFVARLAELGDVFVNEAFSSAHRAHASTEGLARHLPSCAGRLMEAEMEALEKGLDDPQRPVAAIVGGAKVSTKIDLLTNLIEKVECLIIGGGMANTFLAAGGVDIGKSLCEHDLADTARRIMKKAEETGCEIVLPVDAVVAQKFEAKAPSETVAIDAVPADAMILDVGEKSVAAIRERLKAMRTVVWNGPLGAFEIEPFDTATVAIAEEVARMTRGGEIVSIAGGGDTVAALNHAGVVEDMTYVSTAGGAFLEWMEGKPLPGVEILKKDG